jgi:hypothetical protein
MCKDCSCGKNNLYLISQNEITGCDTYDSAVVVAANEHEAKRIHPSFFCTSYNEKGWVGYTIHGTEYVYTSSAWVDFKSVDTSLNIEFLGQTTRKEGEVVIASFNAG